MTATESGRLLFLLPSAWEIYGVLSCSQGIGKGAGSSGGKRKEGGRHESLPKDVIQNRTDPWRDDGSRRRKSFSQATQIRTTELPCTPSGHTETDKDGYNCELSLLAHVAHPK
jgi:hypothetical protein